MSDVYDAQIQSAADKFLKYDWRIYKAQLIAESNLDPEAVSPVGAVGLAQFMPGTWADVLKNRGLSSDLKRTDPEAAIECGAWYMRSLCEQWSSKRPLMDRVCLAMASYNAGLGNILKAQKLADNANLYAQIIAELPGVTGKNSKETINYVKKILDLYNKMVTG